MVSRRQQLIKCSCLTVQHQSIMREHTTLKSAKHSEKKPKNHSEIDSLAQQNGLPEMIQPIRTEIGATQMQSCCIRFDRQISESSVLLDRTDPLHRDPVCVIVSRRVFDLSFDFETRDKIVFVTLHFHAKQDVNELPQTECSALYSFLCLTCPKNCARSPTSPASGINVL